MRFIKLRWWFSAWLKTTAKEVFAPLFDAGALLQTLPVIFVLYLVYLAAGDDATKAEILNIWAAKQTLIAIIPVFIFICMIRSLFLTKEQLGELGQWHGNVFIYKNPQQVFTITVSSEDNNKAHFFKLKEIPVDSLIQLGFSLDRRDNRVKAQITDNGHTYIDWRGATSRIKTGFRLPKNKKLGLLSLADSETDPATIRVYVYSWEVLPNIG